VKQIYIFAFFLVFVLFSIPYGIAQISKDSVFTNLIYNKADITGGEPLFIIKNPTASQITVNKTNFIIDLETSKGVIYNLQIFRNITENKTITEEINVNRLRPITCIDIAENNCEELYNELVNITRYVDYEYEEIKEFTLEKGTTSVIKIVANWKANQRISIDWKPSIKIGALTIKRDDWAWWNTSWGYSRKITFNVTQDIEDINDIPMVAVINTTRLSMKNDCSDARFVTEDNLTELPYRIDGNCTMDYSRFVIKMNITKQANNTIYFYYGNSTAPKRNNDPSPYDKNYTIVATMEEGIGTTVKSTTEFGSINGTMTGAVFIRNADYLVSGNSTFYDGSNDDTDFIDGSFTDVLGNTITIESWINITGNGGAGGAPRIINKEVNIGYAIFKGTGATDTLTCRLNIAGTGFADAVSNSLSRNVWHHVVCIYNITHVAIWTDGVLRNSASTSGNNIVNSNLSLVLGDDATSGTSEFTGGIDEFRLSNTNRSIAYAKTVYDNAIHGAFIGEEFKNFEVNITYPTTAFPTQQVTDGDNITINFTVANFTGEFITENINVSSVTIGGLTSTVLPRQIQSTETITFAYSQDGNATGTISSNCAAPTLVDSFRTPNNHGDNITYVIAVQAWSTDAGAEYIRGGRLLLVNASNGAIIDSNSNEIAVNTAETSNDYVFLYRYENATENLRLNITACADTTVVAAEAKWMALININSSYYKMSNRTITTSKGGFSVKVNTTMRDTSPRIILSHISMNVSVLTGVASVHFSGGRNNGINISRSATNQIMDFNQMTVNLTNARPNNNYHFMLMAEDKTTGGSFENNYTVKIQSNQTVTTTTINTEMSFLAIQLEDYYITNSSEIAIDTTATVLSNISTNYASNTIVGIIAQAAFKDTDAGAENIAAGQFNVSAVGAGRGNITSNQRNIVPFGITNAAGSNVDKALVVVDITQKNQENYTLAARAGATGVNGKGRMLVFKGTRDVQILIDGFQVWFQNSEWHVNVTVPNHASGLKNLFLQVNIDSDYADDIELNAVNYGFVAATDSCTPPVNTNWTIEASDNCVIDGQSISVTRIYIQGATGYVIFRHSNITSLDCRIEPNTNARIMVAVEKGVSWGNSC
jgi:hypothetical protein